MNKIHLFWCKWRRIFFMFSGLFALTSLIGGWPIHYALPVSGTITDEITHEPISNAIIECKWTQKSALGIIEAVGQGIDSDYFVTNERGEYRIPNKFSLHIFSWYSDMDAIVRHPLYETFKLVVIHNKEISARGRGGQQAKMRKFVYNIGLMKLEDKLRNDKRRNSACDTLDVINNFPPYVEAAILAGVCKAINPEEFIGVFEKMLVTTPQHYCKTEGLEILNKLRGEADQHEVYESIGNQRIKIYETPTSNLPSSSILEQLRKAKALRQRLQEGCYVPR